LLDEVGLLDQAAVAALPGAAQSKVGT
jgi:hypothetical protein